MLFAKPLPDPGPLRAALRATNRMGEARCVEERLAEASLPPDSRDRIAATARGLVEELRRRHAGAGGLDAFMAEYELSSEEGIVLMCLAEALLRIPDADTADRLIKDKIGGADWERHLGGSESLFVNASTFALMLTGRVVNLDSERAAKDFTGTLGRLLARSGEPVIRQAVVRGMRILGRQFVMGRTIAEALDRAGTAEKRGYRYSYDMLGEAARTMDDADRYFEAYVRAIGAIGKVAAGRGPVAAPGISVKLSALHPRYEFAQKGRVMAELVPRLNELASLARDADIGFCVDAEEADRLDLSLDVIGAVSADPALGGWSGFGLAVQAYQKRGLPLIDWLADMARRHGRRLMVRLVKGAYWDSEIKWTQELGLSGYPVFTRKASTDVSFIACAKRLFANADAFYPQFATHNAHTLATVLELSGGSKDFEFQRLHGMGADLYDQVVDKGGIDVPCRIYAPVGSHEDLLAYLVRRLLENGANTSFVNRIVDADTEIDTLIADPAEAVTRLEHKAHPAIPLPADLYGDSRRNSGGVDLNDPAVLDGLAAEMETAAADGWQAGPIVGGELRTADTRPATDPADRRRKIGAAAEATEGDVADALARAAAAQPGWDRTPAAERAAALERAADLYESHVAELMAVAAREAGKTANDGIAEVREAVDFLRYYAVRARADFAGPVQLPGPTGERNEIALHGRGVFACISPWNFPLAIFTGQVAAALAAGNTVLAKPAEQTPIMAAWAVQLLHEAGVPGDVLHLLPGDGAAVGGALVGDPRVAGIAFTGGTDTARLINRRLAERDGPIVPLIAETGGQNAMIVDSSALPEQVVRDVLLSAFRSAGQRCSALRVLFVQDDVAERTIEMLAGAMRELKVGDPALLSTDVGPVIDEEARSMLQAHAERMDREAKKLCEVPLGADCDTGCFFAPRAYEIESIAVLEREVFGPILHVVRYDDAKLDRVLETINATGYGLTLGVHSRVDSTIRRIVERVAVGNAYVNRNQIGAIVGVQPFGGEGLSGTGPKAGGPRYLHRFATERVVSTDTTASGGNASLMSLEE
jgi:RHH-type proline utilization regulon transcriptional repressor/proline dehydrogenase/delta 1-pyrroline-5-carboxylate dehydrogenase